MKKNYCIYYFLIVVIIVIGFITELFNIENNKVDKATKENENLKKIIKKNIISIPSDKINKKNNGKFVIVSGPINYSEDGLKDNIFDIYIDAPFLLRSVELYQWVEFKKNDKNGKPIYTYEKTWSQSYIDSSKFHNSKYKNINTKYADSKLYLADKINVGKFELSDIQKQKLLCSSKLKLQKNMDLPDDFKVYNDYITNSKDPKNPKIGDTRIVFCYNDWKTATIIAVQSDKSFKNYIAKDGRELNYIKEGSLSLEDMLDIITKK